MFADGLLKTRQLAVVLDRGALRSGDQRIFDRRLFGDFCGFLQPTLLLVRLVRTIKSTRDAPVSDSQPAAVAHNLRCSLKRELSVVSRSLKEQLGLNADMWQTQSRIW